MSIAKKLTAFFNHTQIMLWAIILSSIYLGSVLYWQSENNRTIDPDYTIQTLETKEQRNSSLVKTGLYINSFPVFSFCKNAFTLDGILWFRFPIGTESLETISNFNIQNASILSGNSLTFKSDPIIKLIGHEVLISYHIQASIKTALNYKNFPVSQYRLNMVISNKNVSARELYFISDDTSLALNDQLLLYSWKPHSINVKTGYTQATLTTSKPQQQIDYPVAVFSIVFDNIGYRDLISLYFPMFVLFLIALFCLLIDIQETARLGYVAATVPILVLFRMVIDASSPDVGNLTHVDFMYNVFVFLSLAILFFQTYVILRLQSLKSASEIGKEQQIQKLATLNNIVFFLVLLALIIGTTATFFR